MQVCHQYHHQLMRTGLMPQHNPEGTLTFAAKPTRTRCALNWRCACRSAWLAQAAPPLWRPLRTTCRQYYQSDIQEERNEAITCPTK